VLSTWPWRSSSHVFSEETQEGIDITSDSEGTGGLAISTFSHDIGYSQSHGFGGVDIDGRRRQAFLSPRAATGVPVAERLGSPVLGAHRSRASAIELGLVGDGRWVALERLCERACADLVVVVDHLSELFEREGCGFSVSLDLAVQLQPAPVGRGRHPCPLLSIPLRSSTRLLAANRVAAICCRLLLRAHRSGTP
jgi:hypothetical protein